MVPLIGNVALLCITIGLFLGTIGLRHIGR